MSMKTTVYRTQTYYSSVILCSIRTKYYNIGTGGNSEEPSQRFLIANMTAILFPLSEVIYYCSRLVLKKKKTK